MCVGVHQPQARSSQTLSWCRGALQLPLSPGMLHTDCLVHVAFIMVDITVVDMTIAYITVVDITK